MEKKQYTNSKLKSRLVLELLRGGDIEEIRRRENVTVSDLSTWRTNFIKQGERGFKRNPEQSQLLEAQFLIIELRKKKSILLISLVTT